MSDSVKDTSIPAFPAADSRSYGMSLRDWFAGQALAGIGVWSPGKIPMHPVDRAAWAYMQADAMLSVRGDGK